MYSVPVRLAGAIERDAILWADETVICDIYSWSFVPVSECVAGFPGVESAWEELL